MNGALFAPYIIIILQCNDLIIAFYAFVNRFNFLLML